KKKRHPADRAGQRGRRPRHAGEDRRRQEPHDPQLRLLRDLFDRRAELRRQHLRPRRREGLSKDEMEAHERATLEALPAVNVEVNGQAAALLVKLMGDFATEQPMAVLTRALGVLEQAVAAKAKGQRLGLYDPKTGRFVDLVV